MEGYTTATTDHPSFASLFARFHYPPPHNVIASAITKDLGSDEVAISGASFLGLQQFSVGDLALSTHHNLTWAKDFLKSYAPIVPRRHTYMWDSLALLEGGPSSIKSDPDVCSYFKGGVLVPALIAAIAIYTKHKDLTQVVDCSHPVGRWEVADLLFLGPSRTAVFGVLFRADCNSTESQELQDAIADPGLIGECKTWYDCNSRGNVEGVNIQSAEVLPQLSSWMNREPNKFMPMDPPGCSVSTRPVGGINWYKEDWQRKIQKFFFQVSFGFRCCYKG